MKTETIRCMALVQDNQVIDTVFAACEREAAAAFEGLFADYPNADVQTLAPGEEYYQAPRERKIKG